MIGQPEKRHSVLRLPRFPNARFLHPFPFSRANTPDEIIRPATVADIQPICELINGFAVQKLMLPRTPGAVRRNLDDFVVAEDGGRIAGCGALTALDGSLMEIRSLAVHPDMHGQGIGAQLVARLLEKARARGAQRVCALTLSPEFFAKQGFHVVNRWQISPKIWQECVYCPKFHACDEVAVLKELGK